MFAFFLFEGLTLIANLLKEGFEDLAGFVLFAILTSINGWLDIFEAALIAAFSILPDLPSVLGPPEYIESINWFVPIGTLIGIGSTLLTGYVIFISVKWVFKKYGEL